MELRKPRKAWHYIFVFLCIAEGDLSGGMLDGRMFLQQGLSLWSEIMHKKRKHKV
jgi:hypothetical protein